MAKRLEQGPEGQPYPVPVRWRWVTGREILRPMETRRPEGVSFRYIDIDAVDNQAQRVSAPKEILAEDAPSRASRAVYEGDTLFSMVRPYLRNIAYIDETLSDCVASTGFFVCGPTEIIDPLYLHYLMRSDYVVNGLTQFMRGDNSPSIRAADIEGFLYPLPPLTEQYIMVERIESLYARLDAAREKVQAVIDGTELRKAAIVSIMDGLTDKENRVRHAAQAVLTRIDAMKRTILTQALRGELTAIDRARMVESFQ